MGSGPEEGRVDIPQVDTDDPALNGQPVIVGSTGNEGFSQADFTRYVETVATLERQGVFDSGDFSFDAMLGYMSIGGGLGALVGPVGALVGAVLGAWVYVCSYLDSLMPYMQPITSFDQIDPGEPGYAFRDYLPVTFQYMIEENYPQLINAHPPKLAYLLLLYWLFDLGKVAKQPGGWLYYASGGPVPNYVYLMAAVWEAGYAELDRPMPANPSAEELIEMGQMIYGPYGVDYLRTVVEGLPAGTEFLGHVSEGTNLVYQYRMGQYQYIPGAVVLERPSQEDLQRQSPRVGSKSSLVGVGILAGLAILAARNASSHGNHART